jgi:hypothetical protein
MSTDDLKSIADDLEGVLHLSERYFSGAAHDIMLRSIASLRRLADGRPAKVEVKETITEPVKVEREIPDKPVATKPVEQRAPKPKTSKPHHAHHR